MTEQFTHLIQRRALLDGPTGKGMTQVMDTEVFNSRFRDKLLNGELFYTLQKAEIIIEQWRKHYNTIRPHSALGYHPPAPQTIVQMDQSPVMH
jgi:transposase InsO family protein